MYYALRVARKQYLCLHCLRKGVDGGPRPTIHSFSQAMQAFTALPFRHARYLPGANIDAVEEVRHGNREDQGRESLFVVIAGGLFPDRVGHGVRLITEAGDGLGERKGGAFSMGEVGRLSPGRYSKEPLVCFACLLSVACSEVNAEATAIDLARAQVGQLKGRRWHAAVSRDLGQSEYGVHRAGNDCCRVINSCLHDISPPGTVFYRMSLHPDKSITRFLASRVRS